MFNLLSYDFMQRAFLAVIAMSLFSPVLGTFLILRRQSLMSDTLSHVSLSGVAFGLVLGISPTISTIVIVLIAAVFLEYLRTVYKSFMEIGTAILMSTGLAVSLIVMSKGKSSSSMSLDQYLFGSIVTISQEQVIGLFVIAAVVLILTFLFLRPIALMIPAAGALLVSTIMVLPASIALRLGKNFSSVMILASVIGFLGMVAGLYISYYAETPPSASITIIFVVVFLVVSLLKRFIK